MLRVYLYLPGSNTPPPPNPLRSTIILRQRNSVDLAFWSLRECCFLSKELLGQLAVIAHVALAVYPAMCHMPSEASAAAGGTPALAMQAPHRSLALALACVSEDDAVGGTSPCSPLL